jgi:hypothetical protein
MYTVQSMRKQYSNGNLEWDTYIDTYIYASRTTLYHLKLCGIHDRFNLVSYNRRLEFSGLSTGIYNIQTRDPSSLLSPQVSQFQTVVDKALMMIRRESHSLEQSRSDAETRRLIG